MKEHRLTERIASALVLLAVLAVAFFALAPGFIEKAQNSVLRPAPYSTSDQALQLHKGLRVADLHADSLLWDRDLLTHSHRGQVDVPRLIDGNVALQAFTVVTRVPSGQNLESNEDKSDLIKYVAIAERWPLSCWGGLRARALYQARNLARAAARSNGKLVLIRTGRDLSDYLERRRQDSEMTAGFLGLEGAHALEGDLSNIDVLFDAGFRMMAPTHFFDNDIGGSAHGAAKGGLTDKGKEMIRRMEARHMLVDVAHASPRTVDDVLAIASRPVVVSHTGVKGTCENTRNLSDDQLKRIAATGGVIGIGYWDTAVCGTDAASIARAIRYAVDLVGADHVALSSDFDGAVSTPFDTTGLVQITEALLLQGLNESQIRSVMGENVIRVLKENLPQE